MKKLLLLLVVGCVNLPHVDPEPRNDTSESASVVAIERACIEEGLARTVWSDLPQPRGFGRDAVWAPHSIGMGVVISERHILTAYHITRCPVIPMVWALLSNGRRIRLVVQREDPKHDLARLDMLSQDNFNLHIAPPTLRTNVEFNEELCVHTRTNKVQCGIVIYKDDTKGYLIDVVTHKGDSGSAVYDKDGNLVGLSVAIWTTPQGHVYTGVTPVTADWLSGT